MFVLVQRRNKSRFERRTKYFEIPFYDISRKPVALVVYKLRVYLI